MRTTADILRFLIASYPRQPLGDETVAAYMMSLRDIDPEQLKMAALAHVSQSKWFPSIAELRQAAARLALGERSSAEEAWGEVMRSMRGGGPVSPLTLEAMNAVGGFQAFGRSDVRDEVSWRARFCEAYNAIADRQERRAAELPAVADYRAQLDSGRNVAGLIGEVRERKRIGAPKPDEEDGNGWQAIKDKQVADLLRAGLERQKKPERTPLTADEVAERKAALMRQLNGRREPAHE